MHWSSVPCTTSTGQVIVRSSASPSSGSAGYGAPSTAAICASAEDSHANPTMSSISLVECGSEQISPKKKSAKPGQSRRQ